MAQESDSNTLNLSDLYEKVWTSFEYLENTADSISSENVQAKVKTAIEHSNKAIQMINELGIFSSNEHIDEVTTLEIKYLLLPAFLGYFKNKNTAEEDRLKVVEDSRECYRNFITLCKTFGLTNVNLKSNQEDVDEKSKQGSKQKLESTELLKIDMLRRQEKIEKFKAVKALEKELRELYVEVKKEHVDEDVKREYFLKLVNKWISDSLDALESMESEIPILEHLRKMKNSSDGSNKDTNALQCNGKECNKHTKQRFQPFIITKDEVQKAVFGLGYPSVPTVTVDEFYNERVQQGLFPGPDAPAKSQPTAEDEEREKEKSAAEKDEKEDSDDVDALKRAREWDEYRDDHRRGWGNTHNKG